MDRGSGLLAALTLREPRDSSIFMLAVFVGSVALLAVTVTVAVWALRGRIQARRGDGSDLRRNRPGGCIRHVPTNRTELHRCVAEHRGAPRIATCIGQRKMRSSNQAQWQSR
jgi:hypothetical protein